MKSYIRITRTVDLKIPISKDVLTEEEIDELFCNPHDSELLEWDNLDEYVQVDQDEVYAVVLNEKEINFF